jgi:hypothetical protein
MIPEEPEEDEAGGQAEDPRKDVFHGNESLVDEDFRS